jgi:hypothetical protein
MESPYRKLFNLFAFILLAFAIYLNFIHTDEVENVTTGNSANYVQAASNQAIQGIAIDTKKPSMAKKN